MKRTAITIKDLEKIVCLDPRLARRVALRAGDKGVAIQDLLREDLLAIKGIGPKKADAILRLIEKSQVPTSPSLGWGIVFELAPAAALILVLIWIALGIVQDLAAGPVITLPF